MNSVNEPIKEELSFALKAVQFSLNLTVRFFPLLAGQLANQLLSRPVKKKLSLEESAFLKRAQKSYFFEKNKQIASYHWKGTGPKILLAHGWDSHSGRWLSLGEELLAAGFDVFAIDAPAHGASKGGSFTVVDYAACLSAFSHQCQPQIIVGHSAGGMALAYGIAHHQIDQSQLKGAVLLGTPGGLQDFLNAFQEKLALKDAVMHNLELDFIQKGYPNFAYFNIANFAKQALVPSLIIHDENDDIAPFSGAEAIHGNWEDSQLVTTTDLGHSLNSQQVNEGVLAFLKQVLTLQSFRVC